ncbi:hypothetical protein CWN93_11625 [Vibrio splendidus]|nr:hypothetical protein CWN93_11625 [Vibrio splendidus]PTP27985.1 hypothetical protein CWN92_16330 [Vibrio splendidus]
MRLFTNITLFQIHLRQIAGNKKPSRSWVCLALISHHELICGSLTFMINNAYDQRGLSID